MFIHKQLDYSVVFQCVTFGINIVLVIIRSLYKVESHVAKVNTCLMPNNCRYLSDHLVSPDILSQSKCQCTF